MSHTCPAPGCKTTVSDDLFLCRRHWSFLPRELQTRVWTAFRDHGVGSPELRAAHAEAIETLRKQGENKVD